MELQLPESLDRKLTNLADQRGRDRQAIVAEAVERLLEYEEWFEAQVNEGLAQVEAGKTLTHAEVGLGLGRLFTRKVES